MHHAPGQPEESGLLGVGHAEHGDPHGHARGHHAHRNHVLGALHPEAEGLEMGQGLEK